MKEKMIKQYPYLKPLTDNDQKNYKNRVVATKNIKIELKRFFPKTTFKVRSKSYSGGDSIDVSWTDGPTSDAVNEIIRKYQAGRFDGMTDCYDYQSTDFTAMFGDAKYVHGQRTISRELAIKCAKKFLPGLTDDQVDKWGNLAGLDYEMQSRIRRETWDTAA